jgi:hypothetical protein
VAARCFPPPWSFEDIGSCFVVKTPTRQRLKSTGTVLTVFAVLGDAVLPAHEEYRRDLKVPEVRLSKAATARHRFVIGAH